MRATFALLFAFAPFWIFAGEGASGGSAEWLDAHEAISLQAGQFEIKLKLERRTLKARELDKVEFYVLKGGKAAGDVTVRLYMGDQRQALEEAEGKYFGIACYGKPGDIPLKIKVTDDASGNSVFSDSVDIKVLPPADVPLGFPIIAFWDAIMPNAKAGVPSREDLPGMKSYVERSLTRLKSHHFNALWAAVPCPGFIEKVGSHGMRTTIGGAPGSQALLKGLKEVDFKIPSPCLKARRIDAAPRIDGNLDDACWSAALPVKDFTLLNAGGMAKEGTIAYVVYDDVNLYVAFKCLSSKMDRIVRDAKKRDAPVWKDDSVEVFLSLSGDKKTFFHFVVNSLNTQLDAKEGPSGSDIGWNAIGWRSATSSGKDGWTVEMAIPFGGMDVATPKDGMSCGFNLAREAPSSSEVGSWSPSYHNLIDPSMFGALVFDGRGVGDAPSCATLSGKVADSAGNPLKGAIAVTGRFVALSDESGGFSFSGLPAGEHMVVAGDIGHESQKRKIEISAAKAGVVSFTLENADHLTLKVRDTYGKVEKSVKDSALRKNSILGYYLIDEPTATVADNMAFVNKLYGGLDPQTPTMSCYLGLSDINALCRKADPPVLLIDVYPLLADSPAGDFKMRGHALPNMDMAEYIDSARGSAKDKPLWVTLPAFSSVWPESGKPRFRMPSPKELRAMVYLSVAHGAKGIAYFLYESVDSKERLIGMIDPDGRPNPIWEEVGKINAELEAIAPTLLKLKFADNIAMPAGNLDAQTFTDSANGRYLFVVNRDVLAAKTVSVDMLKTAGGTPAKAVGVPDGNAAVIVDKGSFMSFDCRLGPGDGRLFKLE